MSFSKPKAQNPCTKYIEFKGDTGIFQYWDKEKGEKGENVVVPTPAYLVVLDELSTIKGFSDEFSTGIYSNEVHYLDREILTVKTFKGGLSIVGKYADIKDKIKANGGKFAKSVYCLMFNEQKETELVNLQLHGSAFGAWMEFKFNQQRNSISLTGGTIEGKKGKTVYKIPIFKKFAIPEWVVPMAIEADTELQEYFKQYKGQLQEKEIAEQEQVSEPTGEENLYNETYAKDKPMRSQKADEFDGPPPEYDERFNAPLPPDVDDDENELPF